MSCHSLSPTLVFIRSFYVSLENYDLAVTTDIDHAVLEIDKRVRDISSLCSKLFTTEVGLTLLRPSALLSTTEGF
jgi:hypothetical protein